jgi:hypothetical protein
VQDLRLPGMVHARVVRPPSYGAKLDAVDTAEVEKMPGVVKIVRDGNFLAVVAQREFQAVKAMRKLSAAARWHEAPRLPNQGDLAQAILALPARDYAILDRRQPDVAAAKKLEATYTRLDRPVLRGRAARRRDDDCLEPYPGRLSGSRRDRRHAAHCKRKHPLHPRRRLGLLRPQRRRRRGG